MSQAAPKERVQSSISPAASQGCGFCGERQVPVRTISREGLLREYETMFGVRFPPRILESTFRFTSLEVLECSACKTIGYTPGLAGGGEYYTHLSQNLSWYYTPERWEYGIALELFKRESVRAFLEVGCGAGHFLRAARDRGIVGDAFEIEPDSISRLHSEGFRVLTDPIQDGGIYDALAMFQVLEHLESPRDFLRSVTRAVRSGGLILVSTPVTPSCALFSDNAFLFPPHHCWLPTVEGYHRLADRLGLEVEQILFDCPDPNQVRHGLWKRSGIRLPMRLADLFLRAARRAGLRWSHVGHTTLVVLRTKQ